MGIAKWSDFENYQRKANNWLAEAEKLVQSFSKLKPNLDEKKTALEQFQVHLEALFDWQRELDELNLKAQVFYIFNSCFFMLVRYMVSRGPFMVVYLIFDSQELLDICADARVSSMVTQMSTKYNALLSIAKETMRKLELYYQEHQQLNSLYQECLDFVARTKEKVRTINGFPLCCFKEIM